jgi:cellulose synthase/poly-beta-1,6-N-acetylglucosamine synthase-like glycosyltransferase
MGSSKKGTKLLDVSLIIVTRNRCRQLSRCLQSVACLTFERPWELIIVDSSTDETASMIQEFIRTAPIPVRYLFESKPGIGNARNAGLETARGEIVAFTDDDCYPAPDFLSSGWSAFEDQSVGYITGRILLHDPADYPVTINESTTPRTFPARSFIRAGDVQGANMAFRREVLLDIGGFDPHVPAEDVDVASRASENGWEGRYRPEVIVRHHHGRKASDVPSLWKVYSIGRGAYHMKLLLNGRHLGWFIRAVYEVRWRYKGESLNSVIWEQVGAARYAGVWLIETLRRWFRAAHG